MHLLNNKLVMEKYNVFLLFPYEFFPKYLEHFTMDGFLLSTETIIKNQNKNNQKLICNHISFIIIFCCVLDVFG